jgi:hypothetical protein
MPNTPRHRGPGDSRVSVEPATGVARACKASRFSEQPLYYGWTGDALAAEIALFGYPTASNKASARIVAKGIGPSEFCHGGPGRATSASVRHTILID